MSLRNPLQIEMCAVADGTVNTLLFIIRYKGINNGVLPVETRDLSVAPSAFLAFR